MSESLTIDVPVPGDPSGSALGISLRQDDIDKVLRPGLSIVQGTMPTLAAKAEEILAEIDDPKNPSAGKGCVLVKVDRKVDEQLLGQRTLKVLDCDKEKILALVAALSYEGSTRARELRGIIMESLLKGGIPIRVEGEPKLGGSVHIRILDQSLELKRARPA